MKAGRGLEDHVRFGWQLLSGWRIKHESWIANLRNEDVRPYLAVKESLAWLDLANGQLRPQYKLMRAEGYRVWGVDLVNRPRRSWQNYAYAVARWLYTRQIKCDHRLADETLICGDVSSLPCRDESFDAITSVAAFEHFLDVPKVLKELHRVSRRGAIIWVLVHPFTCPSGGHNVKLMQIPLREVPANVDPWDHLRKRRVDIMVPLNEWRKDQYLTEFRKHFEILKEYCAA